MQIFSSTLNFHLMDDTVVTIGKFDGIHKGHLEIIRKMFDYRKEGLKLAVLTFDTPPAKVIDCEDNLPSSKYKVLTTTEEKRKLFQEVGVDYLVEFPFNDDTKGISPEEFIRQILMERMRMCAIVVGSDCSFGKGGRGDSKLLEQFGMRYGFYVDVIEKAMCFDREISSSYIRELIEFGDIGTANTLLMRPYVFYGEVTHEGRISKELGIPTVYIVPQAEKLLPPSGVYYSRVNHLGREYRAITNITNKVVKGLQSSEPVVGVETYIYNFDEDVVGENVFVSLYKFVRDEIQFEFVEMLRNQTRKDIEQGKIWHMNHL